MGFQYGSVGVPAPSGTNTFLSWTGSAFAWTSAGTSAVDNSGNIASVSALTWGAGVSSPVLIQATAGSDVATQDLELVPQAPFATAITNIKGGRLWISLAAPISGTTQSNEASLHITRGGSGTVVWDLEYLPAPGGQFGGAAAGIFARGNNSTTNYALGADTANTWLNASSNAGISIGGSALVKCTATNVVFGQPLSGNGTTPIQLGAATVALTISPQTVSSPANYLKFTGSLSGNFTVVLSATDGAHWFLDFTQITFNAHTITIQANGNNWGTTVSAGNMVLVTYNAASGKLWGTALTA